jgi:hypothetical protein
VILTPRGVQRDLVVTGLQLSLPDAGSHARAASTMPVPTQTQRSLVPVHHRPARRHQRNRPSSLPPQRYY